MERLSINNFSKHYEGFDAENISFSVNAGSIVGLIGENGAGKSTVIKSILGLVHADGGEILLDGQPVCSLDAKQRQQIAFVTDNTNLPVEITPVMLQKVLSEIFYTWDGDKYFRLVRQMELPEKIQIKKFSKGMKMKLSIAVAFSHNSKLLVLDEATSGLDPIVRDEILDMFNEFTRDETHSILLSSHIVTDLEKICDYIAILHQGKLLCCEEKDALLERFGLVQCSQEQLAQLPAGAVQGQRSSPYGVRALVLRQLVPPELHISPVNLEELFVFLVKERV